MLENLSPLTTFTLAALELNLHRLIILLRVHVVLHIEWRVFQQINDAVVLI